jgi:hypothetical protein
VHSNTSEYGVEVDKRLVTTGEISCKDIDVQIWYFVTAVEKLCWYDL